MSRLDYHENEKGFQKIFHKDIRALVGVIEEFGNPLEEEGKELSVFDTKVVADEEWVSRMQNIEELGRKQCDAFIALRLIERKKPLDDPITRNTLSFFETPIKKKTSKAHQQLSSMKNDCSLFSRLFIAFQTRNGDLDEFFQDENQACPPSISYDGNLRLPQQKSADLATCLQAVTTPQRLAPDNPDAIIMDGAAIVNMVKLSIGDKTFEDYAANRFNPYITSQLQTTKRIDIVWDEYIELSLFHDILRYLKFNI